MGPAANKRVSIAYRLVDGSEAAPTASWSPVGNGIGRVFQWSGVAQESPFASGANGSNTGTGATHSKTGVTTTRDESRVIYIDGCDANTALGTPSGWTEDSDAGGGGDEMRIAVGGKDVATSGSASGDISVTGGNAAWVMWQIELRSPPAGHPAMRRLGLTSFSRPVEIGREGVQIMFRSLGHLWAPAGPLVVER